MSIWDRRILAVVPARGGSEGIWLKNLREVGGRSLVALAGDIAAAVIGIDRRIVSTDLEKIAAAARDAGLDAPFLRPPSLSGPAISDFMVLHHALREMESMDECVYDVVVMLQPTSPNRTVHHVGDAIHMLIGGNYDSVWTVSRADLRYHPLKQLRLHGGNLEYYDKRGAGIIARQQLEPLYVRNGAAYVVTRDCLYRQRNIHGERCGAFVIDDELANIDSELDLKWAEFLMENNQ